MMKNSTEKANDDKGATFKFKKEQLDISKDWVQTGDANIYKESSTVDKTFTIPVESEYLVIEKKILASSNSKDNDTADIIRIPLSEEKVEFTKEKVTLEDVSIYKQKIEDIKRFEITLKREEPKIKISGSLKIKD